VVSNPSTSGLSEAPCLKSGGAPLGFGASGKFDKSNPDAVLMLMVEDVG
jgi:hypothetical protein